MRLPQLPKLSFRLLYYVLLTFVAVAIVEPQLFKSHRRSQWVYAPGIQYSAKDAELNRILQMQPIAIDAYSYEPIRARIYVFAGLAITLPCSLFLLWRRKGSGPNERPHWRDAYFMSCATVLLALLDPLLCNAGSGHLYTPEIRYHANDPALNERLEPVKIGIDNRTCELMDLQSDLVFAIVGAWVVIWFCRVLNAEVVLVGNIQPKGRLGPAAGAGRPG